MKTLDYNKIHKEIKRPSRRLIDMLGKNDYVIGGAENSYSYISKILNKQHDNAFKNFLYILADQKSEILEDKNYIMAIHNTIFYSSLWVRDILTWTKKSRSRHKQFIDIISHLFCLYKVPSFMYNVWNDRTSSDLFVWRMWFIDMAQGKNIRYSDGLPIKMTKKVAHLFSTAPDNFMPLEAIRYAQVVSMGGDMRTVGGVLSTKLADNFSNNDFWESVIRFFIKNPMLDTAQYNPIVDYIMHQKFVSQNMGGIVVGGPPQPNFSMKDRNPNALIAQVEDWHRKLNNERGRKENIKWDPFKIDNFTYTTGKDEHRKTYKIIQLLSSNEIRTEGRTMHHCVASYIGSCASGRTSIWSMTVDTINGTDRLLTIEVNKDHRIHQIRGKYDRTAEKNEMSIIELWAYNQNLFITRWCMI